MTQREGIKDTRREGTKYTTQEVGIELTPLSSADVGSGQPMVTQSVKLGRLASR